MLISCSALSHPRTFSSSSSLSTDNAIWKAIAGTAEAIDRRKFMICSDEMKENEPPNRSQPPQPPRSDGGVQFRIGGELTIW